VNWQKAAPVALSVGLVTQAGYAEVSLQTQAPAKVEAGQTFTVQLTAMAAGADDAPSQPRLSVPQNFSAQGPSVSTQYQVTTVNGRFEQHQGVTASWLLVTRSLGRFRIGPASVTSAGHVVADRPFLVEVVAAGTLQPQRNRAGRRSPFDPFDPFGDFDPFSSPMLPRMRGFGQFPNLEPDQPQINSWPREFDIAQPRDPTAFLDARIAPKRVVIGQQVTISIYAYGHPGLFELGSVTEPSFGDFLSYDLMEDGSSREQPMRIGEDVWYAQKLRERALFPLHSGQLQIGSMRAKFQGVDPAGQAGYRNIQRQSQPLSIVVVEPPVSGRPSGYRLGDVGQFRLTATVEPREVVAHEAVAVNFELSGTGNVPQHLDLPEHKGTEWLEPTTNETIERRSGKIGGKRIWQYVVQLHEAGTVDLGSVRLPYFDPERGQYAFASAELGQVVVRPGAVVAGAAPVAPSTEDNLAQSLLPREHLGTLPPPQKYWADSRHFWSLLLLGPLGVIVSACLKILGAKGLIFWSQRRDSVKRRTVQQLRVARELLSHGDAAGAASALERSLHMAIEAATNLRARGIIRNQLLQSLTTAGLTQSEAEQAVVSFDACDAVRFTGGPESQLIEPLARADSFVEELSRRAARAKKMRGPHAAT
jgi:hypothetical protein